MPAHYFLGNQLLGAGDRAPWWSDTEVADHCQVFICPKCGDVWGRIVTLGDWLPVRRACLKHGGGSFIAPWRTSFDELPPEVLRYELQLRLRNLE